MAIRLPVPHYTYADVRGLAARFLADRWAGGQLPVDIERITEIGMGIGIDPIPGCSATSASWRVSPAISDPSPWTTSYSPAASTDTASLWRTKSPMW